MDAIGEGFPPTAVTTNVPQGVPSDLHSSGPLEISGDDAAEYDIRILDLVNNVFEVRSKLKYNEAYQLGAELPRGLYVLKSKEGNKMSTMRIIKR